jgi:hypothetical protein
MCLLLVLIVTQVRSLIEDIRDVRFHKVETGLETISGRTHAVKVTFPFPLNNCRSIKAIIELDVITTSPVFICVSCTTLTSCFIDLTPTIPYSSCLPSCSSKISLQWKWTLSALSWWELCRHSISMIVHRWFSKQIIQGAEQHQLQTVAQE